MQQASRSASTQITRWHFIRHAPVLSLNDRPLYASPDEPADTNDHPAFIAMADFLPQQAVWLTSPLQRAEQTADALAAAGLSSRLRLRVPELAEQRYGRWHSLTASDLAAFRTRQVFHKMWFTTAQDKPPEGESFLELIERVRTAMYSLTQQFKGQSLLAICHGGTIRAALAIALGLDANTALTISAENLSTTRLDHVPGPGLGGDWRLVYLNRRPHG
jgi:alpha-ribazole phosphatase